MAGLLTNNSESERHLAGFGKRAALAKFRNKRFTAKGIRNDCTLLISDSFQTKHEKKLDEVVKLLNEIEKKWVAGQKVLKLKQIKGKIKWVRKGINTCSVLNCVKSCVGL